MDSATPSAFRALRTRQQWFVFLAMALVSIAIAHRLDAVAWEQLRDARIYEKDLGRLLRLMGYLPVWLIVAVGLWTHDHADPHGRAIGWGWRGGLVLLAPTAGGAVAEILKMLTRRLRPVPDLFAYQWRPFSDDFFSTRGLGLPSSHTMVAFAGAAALARLFPRAWGLWYLLATGCAVTRVLALGHFLSDVVVAAFLGYVVGVLMARWGGFGRSLRMYNTEPLPVY